MFSNVWKTALTCAAMAGLVLTLGAAPALADETPGPGPVEQEREFIFYTSLVLVEEDRVIVRVPAKEGAPMRIWIGDQEFEGKIGADAKVTVTVDSPDGEPGEFPFDTVADRDYDPYIEFEFIGGSELEKIELEQGEGLLVRTTGTMTVHDETGALPFSPGQLVEAGRIDMSEDDGNLGPHTPDRVV